MTDTTAAPAGRRYRLSVLAMLLLVYTFNFIDRQIIGVLAGPIKADLGLTDTELGYLGGLSFALLYSTLAIPIAWFADRSSRTWIITVSLTVWSGFTAACGLAQNFTQLFLMRMGVGVGEAGGVAPSYSLVADYFPVRERARALAAYSLGIPIGSALGVIFGGLIAAAVDWRWAFITVGLAGVLIAPVFRLIVRDPPRPTTAAGDKIAAPSFGRVLATLLPKPSFWLLALGASCSSIMGYGLIFWLPSFFGRSYGLELREVAWFYGSIVLVGGVIGVWGGGWLADRLGRRGPTAYPLVPALAFTVAAPAYFVALLVPSLAGAWVVFLIPTALTLMWLGPVITAVQHLVPPPMRSTASAAFLFINNLVGIGLGTLFLGRLSDSYAERFGDESLRYSILTGLVFYALAAVLLFVASRTIRKDWVAD